MRGELDHSGRKKDKTRVNPITDADTSADTDTSGVGGPEGAGCRIRHQNHLLNSRTGHDQGRGRSAQDHNGLHGVQGPTASIAADEQCAPLVSDKRGDTGRPHMKKYALPDRPMHRLRVWCQILQACASRGRM